MLTRLIRLSCSIYSAADTYLEWRVAPSTSEWTLAGSFSFNTLKA